MAKKLPSTQDHLDIEDIRDNLVVLKNGNISLILETNSLNFELLSEPEQDSRILAFANLLNSLNFPLQIVVRTERADINDYLDRLVEQRDKHISKALRRQMEIYIKFVQNLTVKTDILNKRFFVVITTNFMPMTQTTSLFDSVLGKSKSVNVYANLEKAKTYLLPKREFLVKQFRKMGVKAVQLNNDQLLQLFYDIYDPDKVGIKKVNITETEYMSGLVTPLTDELISEAAKSNTQKT